LSNFDLEQELTSAFTEEQTENTASPTLALYMTPICPYCIYVRSAASSLGLDIEMKNIYKQQHFDDLLAARNRATVPVLRISYPNGQQEEKWLPESMDIIAYLKGLKASD